MKRAFNVFGAITLGAVLFLMLVGATVRASGAGMGCPDWPKCFGQWIPPTDVSQLPPDYQEIYAHRGYADTEFNVVKTWTEYINRLIGVLVGILVFGTLLLSFAFWRHDKWVAVLSAGAFISTGFAGWLGKIVVESVLSPALITLHMITALVIVACLVWALVRARKDMYGQLDRGTATWIRRLALICLALTIIQIMMGTQVRQDVDGIKAILGEDNRHIWAVDLGTVFYVHRSFSLIVLGANLALIYLVARRANAHRTLGRASLVIIAMVTAEFLGGAGMYYLGFPRVLQPIHLVAAAVLFAAQMHIWLVSGYMRRDNREFEIQRA